MNHVDAALAEFNAQDYTVKITHAVFGVLPFAPAMPAYRTLDEAIGVLYPQATPEMRARAHALAGSDEVKSALWAASAVDTGDTGIAVFSGMKSALGFFFGDKQNALETDSQQGVDAVLKLLAVAYIASKLFPGTLSERVQLFQTAPAGQALAIYFASVEVALPFADNVLTGSGNVLSRLLDQHGNSAAGKLGAVIGGNGLSEAQGMLGTLTQPLEGIVAKVGPYARTIAESAKAYVPGFMTAADQVGGVVATGADALPVYKYLCARLAAETCVLLASRGQLRRARRGFGARAVFEVGLQHGADVFGHLD